MGSSINKGVVVNDDDSNTNSSMAEEDKVSRAAITNDRGLRWTLQGATALVTGGTKGIGHAIVEELVGFGASVHLCARNEAELGKCLRRWEELRLPVTGSACDVSSRADREKLMEKVTSIFGGKLNILVNNAGTALLKSTIDCTAEDYSHIMTTNFESAFHLSQLAYPLLKASGSGSIIFISAIVGLTGSKNLSIYSASKGATNQLTKNLACEWAKDNIRSNCIAPGLIKTPLIQPLLDSEAIKKEASLIPLGRAGEPEDVASLVAFLCLPAASFITGEIICADGGRRINL